MTKIFIIYTERPVKELYEYLLIVFIFAGLLEIIWAFFMKQSAGFTKLIPSIITIITMIVSFSYFLFL